MSSKKLRRKGVVSSGETRSNTNSLDWDSPSNITGTVKRRPVSSDCTELKAKEITEDIRGNLAPSTTAVTITTTKLCDNIELNETKPIKVELNQGKLSLNPLKTSLEIELYTKVDDDVNLMQIQHNNLIKTKQETYKSNASNVTLIPTRINLNSLRNPSNDQKKSNDTVDYDTEGGGFLYDTNSKIETSDSYTYLIERKTWKNGKVSDSDSGIASPLSPSSLYGFPVLYDKDERYEKDKTIEERLKKQSISYYKHHIQVKKRKCYFF